MTVRVRDMEADEWPLWRELRLRALSTNPRSFDETYEQAIGEPDSYWTELLVPVVDHPRARLLFAEIDEVPVGMAFTSIDADFHEHRLGGMYVAPEARGRGVGRTLAEEAIRWGEGLGATVYELWVTEGNEVATGLYQSLGYEATTTTRSLREGAAETIVLMRRSV